MAEKHKHQQHNSLYVCLSVCVCIFFPLAFIIVGGALFHIPCAFIRYIRCLFL